MSIDTAAKRRRAFAVATRIPVYPTPSGTIGATERAHVLYSFYAGIAGLGNRYGFAGMIERTLENDTGILYGDGLLIDFITTNKTLYERAKTDVDTSYKMYLNIESKTTVDVRSQNTDEEYICAYRIGGVHSDPDTAAQNLDKIEERVVLLINTQMWTGNNFTGFYADSKIRYVDAEYSSSEHTVETKGGKSTVEAEGTITIFVNRDI